jgi:hypothetical protein
MLNHHRCVIARSFVNRKAGGTDGQYKTLRRFLYHSLTSGTNFQYVRVIYFLLNFLVGRLNSVPASLSVVCVPERIVVDH